MKRKIKHSNIYSLIVGLLLLVVTLLNTYSIIKYDVLPLKFLILYLLIFCVIPISIFILTRLKRLKKAAKGIIHIIETIYLIIMSVAFIYLNQTFNFLDDFNNKNNLSVINYYVVARNDEKYTNMNNIYNIGFISQDNNVQEALKKLDKKKKLENIEYDDVNPMYTSLIIDEIDSMLITESYYDMLKEQQYDFSKNTKIVYKFKITKERSKIGKEVNVTKEPFAIYISGTDSDNEITSETKSDVNIIAVVNPKSYQVLLINIPRDYYVPLAGYNSNDKLTHAGMYGIDVSVKTIENLLDLEINYYIKVNYSALTNVIDALDGVDVYSEYDFYSTFKNYHYMVGYNHVNGDEALQFVRTRKAFVGGDRVRGKNQQAMISAIINKATSSKILLKYNDVLKSLKGTFLTNITTDTITDLVKYQLNKMPKWNITSISLDGTDGNEYTYSYKKQQLYVMIPTKESIEDASEKINLVKKGEILESSYEN